MDLLKSGTEGDAPDKKRKGDGESTTIMGRIPRKTARHPDTAGEDLFGGHSLRHTLKQTEKSATATTTQTRKTTTPMGRPTSVFSTPTKQRAPTPPQLENNNDGNESYDTEGGNSNDDDDDDNDDDDDDDDAEDEGNGDGNVEVMETTEMKVDTNSNTPTAPTQPCALSTIPSDSRLGYAAGEVVKHPGFSLLTELYWQSQTKGDSAKLRTFRHEVTHQNEIVAFVFMRPSSPYLQLLHSISTYAVRGGESDLHNKDFGFVGDRTESRIPTPVLLEEKMWKYVAKKIVNDPVPLEHYYATPGNAKKLYIPTNATGASNINVPRMLHLPPPFLAFCLEQQSTPFDLHQFVIKYATREGSETNIADCSLLMDWCLVAAHGSTLTSSILEVPLQTAPNDDDCFLRWLRLTDCTLDLNIHPPTPTQRTPPPAPPQPPRQSATVRVQPTAPAQDVWTQMAANISSTIAAAAAAIQPVVADPAPSTYEDGGKYYDKFQLAILMGFAQTDDVANIPRIWASFQYTKNMDTHKDNIKRGMMDWATSDIHPMHVAIDRSLLLTTNTVREILALKFTPNGLSTDTDTAHLGMSILVCRSRPAATAAAIRRHELIAERSRRSRTLAEAEQEQLVYDTGMALPDDYDDLLRCLGTYCALLFTLFGKRCTFYRHCYQIWTTMNSDYCLNRRQNFTVLFCRQIVWAIIEESRAFFTQRLSPDDFIADHPEDVKYPRSKLLRIDDDVRDGIPIARASFPPAWMPGASRTQAAATGGGGFLSTASQVPSVIQPAAATPSVVSGITTGGGSRTTAKPPVTIRQSDVHPMIKSAMEPYISKVKGVWLSAMLSHVNLTIDDLPKLAPEVSGTNGVCYNFILGRCASDACNHKDGHVHATDVTDEFASDLLAKIRPAITEFMTNGLPPGVRRQRSPRRNRGRRNRNE